VAEESLDTSIIVADVPEGQHRAKTALKHLYKLSFASTLREAERLLTTQHFDLLIVGIHFDESRGMELLKFVQGAKQLKIPVLVIQEVPPELSTTSDIVDVCAPMLGACEVLKTWELSAEIADHKLREAVKTCLAPGKGQPFSEKSPINY
jgi:hypothetical protein